MKPWILIIGFSLCISSSSAFAATSSSKSKKQKSRSQISVAQAPTPTPTPEAFKYFSGSLGFQLKQNLKEDSKLNSKLVGELVYQFRNDSSLSLSGEFNHSFTKYYDPNINHALSDLQLTYTQDPFWKSTPEGWSADWNAGLIAPTSRISRNSSMILGEFASIGVKKQIPIGEIGLSNDFYAYQFNYETADNGGSQYNEPFALWPKLRITYKIIPHLNFSTEGSLYISKNFAGTVNSLYRVVAGPTYSFQPGWSIGAKIEVKDRVITQNSLFAEENFSLSLTLLRSL